MGNVVSWLPPPSLLPYTKIIPKIIPRTAKYYIDLLLIFFFYYTSVKIIFTKMFIDLGETHEIKKTKNKCEHSRVSFAILMGTSH